MKRRLLFLLPLALVLIVAVVLLARRAPLKKEAAPPIPSIGSIQLMNGCGIRGAATVVRAFLRDKGFDVKKAEDAPDLNYTETIVVSRTRDMTTARLAARALGTENVVLMRDDARLYDVTIFIGRDYRKRVLKDE